MSLWDLLIRSATLVDGTGNTPFEGDIAVKDGVIREIGKLSSTLARETVDAVGLAATPGFIDMHTHSDIVLWDSPAQEAKVSQGVTTEVIGHDGLSYAPVTDESLELLLELTEGLNGRPLKPRKWNSVSEYLSLFDGHVATNIAFLIPHGTIRVYVMGMDDRAPTPSEIEKMKQLVEVGMSDGAFGLSTALSYPPCSYANADELAVLCSAMAPFRRKCENTSRGQRPSGAGFFAPHLRNYGTMLKESIDEAVSICRIANVPLHLTHFQMFYDVNDGLAEPVLHWLDQEASGQCGLNELDITFDAYPYLRGATFLIGLFPSWVAGSGASEAMVRLADEDVRARLKNELEAGCDAMHGVPARWDQISITHVVDQRYESAIGLTLEEYARKLDDDPLDLACDMLIHNKLKVGCTLANGNARNLERVLSHPFCMVGSDGILVGARPHPRAYGSHTRFLGQLEGRSEKRLLKKETVFHQSKNESEEVFNLCRMSFEEAVRKITSLPAQRLGLNDRGVLAPGCRADVVLLDPEKLCDRATYESPRARSEGIEWVWINGCLAVSNGDLTGIETSGRALRRSGD